MLVEKPVFGRVRLIASGRVLATCSVGFKFAFWYHHFNASPSGRAFLGVGLQPLAWRMWVRIPPAAWMSVCCECCVLPHRGLCDGLITCPEESYRLWCVVVCDLEISRMRRSWRKLVRSATKKKKKTWFSRIRCGNAGFSEHISC